MGDHRHHRSSREERYYNDDHGDRRSSKRSRYDDDEESDRKERRRHQRERSRSPRRSKHKDKESSSSKKRETSRERAERKASKAAAKEASRRANAEAALDLYGSGLGDSLGGSTSFVWHKKRQADSARGLSAAEASSRDSARRQEAEDEIEKLNRRRAEREKEQEQREQEAARNAVASEDQAMREWIAKEDEFYLQQSKRRAEIRVRERRAKPVDYLALNLKWSRIQAGDGQQDEQDQGEGLDVDLEEPYAIFENITLEETEDLEQDIKMYLSLESNPANVDFWRSMLLVCASALEEARTKRRLGSAYATQAKSADALRSEFAQLLRGKTLDQLNSLQENVQRKLTSGEPIDVEYWEQLLKELIVCKARSKLRDMHQVVLRNRLEQLRRQQRDEARAVRDQLATSLSTLPGAVEDDAEEPSAAVEGKGEGETVREPWDASMDPPALTHLTNEDRALDLMEDDLDRVALVLARRKVHAARFVSRAKPLNAHGGDADDDEGNTKDAAAEALYQHEMSKGLDEDEELFNMEEELSKQSYVWEDKYRPRKPRYFNKVMTGFEWNKYNQTHYDYDNPPPKVVTGYRMVLFYPDLIDKTKAPTFNVLKSKDNPDVATLVFKAGPPYEDIAFQIVNREWEYSHKRGFRCSFDRGVLQLAFTFKRLHYRK